MYSPADPAGAPPPFARQAPLPEHSRTARGESRQYPNGLQTPREQPAFRDDYCDGDMKPPCVLLNTGTKSSGFPGFLFLHQAASVEGGATLPDGRLHAEGVMETMNGEILQIAIQKYIR